VGWVKEDESVTVHPTGSGGKKPISPRKRQSQRGPRPILHVCARKVFSRALSIGTDKSVGSKKELEVQGNASATKLPQKRDRGRLSKKKRVKGGQYLPKHRDEPTGRGVP